jgi:hypothetical protein
MRVSPLSNRRPSCVRLFLQGNEIQHGTGKRFQASWVIFGGSGFPAAMIEAESLSHKKTLLADKVAPRAIACY